MPAQEATAAQKAKVKALGRKVTRKLRNGGTRPISSKEANRMIKAGQKTCARVARSGGRRGRPRASPGGMTIKEKRAAAKAEGKVLVRSPTTGRYYSRLPKKRGRGRKYGPHLPKKMKPCKESGRTWVSRYETKSGQKRKAYCRKPTRKTKK